MRFWLKSNLVVVAGLISSVVGLSNLWFSNLKLLLPSTQTQMFFAPAPIYIAMGLIPAMAIAVYLDGTRNTPWHSSKRPRLSLNVLFFSICIVPMTISALAMLGKNINALGCIQNAILFTGLVLAGNTLITRGYSTVWPLSYIMLASLFGRIHLDGYLVSANWAFILDSTTSVDSCAISIAVLATGITFHVAGYRNPNLLRIRMLRH